MPVCVGGGLLLSNRSLEELVILVILLRQKFSFLSQKRDLELGRPGPVWCLHSQQELRPLYGPCGPECRHDGWSSSSHNGSQGKLKAGRSKS